MKLPLCLQNRYFVLFHFADGAVYPLAPPFSIFLKLYHNYTALSTLSVPHYIARHCFALSASAFRTSHCTTRSRVNARRQTAALDFARSREKKRKERISCQNMQNQKKEQSATSESLTKSRARSNGYRYGIYRASLATANTAHGVTRRFASLPRLLRGSAQTAQTGCRVTLNLQRFNR